jgi:hypothetical protein
MGVQKPYLEDQPFPTIDMTPLNNYVGAFAGVVVNESWSQLEPLPGDFNWTPLTQSLQAVSNWNQLHPNGQVGVKLRIFAGYSAPNWVIQQSGSVNENIHGINVTMGRWWTSSFQSAWHNFQLALGAKFDSDPLIRQVSVSSCSSSTGEPFVVSGSIFSQRNLAAAGWNIQEQEQCLNNAIGDYSNWKTTPITFAMVALYDPSTPGVPNSQLLNEIVQKCASSKSQGGPTCIVGNNDLASTAIYSRFTAPFLSEISSLYSTGNGPTVYFQTTGTRLTCQTINFGLKYHASSIELWSPDGNYPGFTVVPPSTLSSWNQALRNHASTVAC